jgi:hypothetical protein
MIVLVSLAMSAVLCAPGFSGERMVHRRAGAPSIPVEQVEVQTDGLKIFSRRNGLDETQLIPWDRVAGVDEPLTGRQPIGLEDRLRVGSLLWRGRTRLLRGDARLAAPVFQEAWTELALERSAAAALAAEGLVRASIARGVPHEAFVPALALAALNGEGFRAGRFQELPPLFDRATGLVADLPPVSSEPDRAAAVKGLDSWIASARGDAQVRGQLFRAILLRESIDGDGLGSTSDDGGIKFLRLLAETGAFDADIRHQARRGLHTLREEVPLWQQAWIAFFIGRSLAEFEEDPALRRLGMLELLHVPPLGAAAPSGLSLRSLRLAASTAVDLGREREAAILESLALVLQAPPDVASETSP